MQFYKSTRLYVLTAYRSALFVCKRGKKKLHFITVRNQIVIAVLVEIVKVVAAAVCNYTFVYQYINGKFAQ